MSYQHMNAVKPDYTVFKKQMLSDRAGHISPQKFGQPMLELQTTMGNRALQGLVGSCETTVSQSRGPSVSIQRLQRLESEPKISESVEGEDLTERLDKASQGGSSLDSDTQLQLEQGLGAGLSNVRVHTDAEADRLSSAVNAVAFATGQHIFFSSGSYNPATPEGLWLLAHEAAHTLQQASGPVDGIDTPEGVLVSDPSDAFEQAADGAADRVLSGESAALSPSVPAAGSDTSTTIVAREEDNDWWGLLGDIATETVPAGLGLLAGAGAIGAGATLAPIAAVAGAGALGYKTGSSIAEHTQADEEIGDALFDVLGPEPGLWLADTFGW